MHNKHFLNGDLVSEEELLISPRDLGYSRGYSVFEFLRTYNNGEPFLLEKHISRLYNSAQKISLSIPWTQQQVSEWVRSTLRSNDLSIDKVIRITISGGVSYTFLPNVLPTIMIIIDDVIISKNEHYKNGVNAYLIDHQRYKPNAKTTNYIEAVSSFQQLKMREVDEIIYYSNNKILEGYRSNIFVIMKDKIITPRCDVLPGITRGVLLEILNTDIPVSEGVISVDDVYTAEEIFVTASAEEIMPVTQVDGHVIGSGSVGPYTRQAMNQLKAYIRSNQWLKTSSRI